MDIERQLSSIDVEARRGAVLMLAAPGADQSENVRLLLKAMQDASWRVRKTAVDILLEQYVLEAYIDGLVKLLYLEDNAGARNTAIELLTKLGKNVTNYLIDAFDTTNHDVRKFVIDIIGEIRDTKSLPLLIDALKDEDENVRASAVEHLGTMREPTAVDALVDIINGDDLWTAYPAADALGMIGDKRAIPALIEVLGKKTLREPVLKALGRLADETTVEKVVSFIEDKSSSVRKEALNALETMYKKGVPEEHLVESFKKVLGDRAIETFLAQATSGKSALRGPAILFLGIMRDKRALDPLLEMAVDQMHADEVKKALVYIGKENPEALVPLFERESPYMKRFICEVASEVASPVYYDTMVALLDDEDGHVRAIAALALANIGDRKAISFLYNLFTDSFEDVQEASIKALGALREGIDMGDVLRMIEDRDPVVRKNAALLLGELAPEDAVSALCFARKDSEVSVRRAVVIALAAIRTKESAECLIKALTDEDSDIRASAALSIGSAGAAVAVEPLCLLLKDTDEMVKVAAARALGTLSVKRAVPDLVDMLSDPNGFVVTAIITALGKTGGEAARSALLKMLLSRDAEIKRTAITSLARFDDVESSLIPFLSDDDWAARVAAVEALGGRKDEHIRKAIGKVYDTEQDAVVRKTIERYLSV